MRNKTCEMKNMLHEINKRLNTVEEKIYKLEEIAVETMKY